MRSFAAISFIILLASCSKRPTTDDVNAACDVIDVAHKGCMLIRYKDATGKVRERKVTHDELRGYASSKESPCEDKDEKK